MSESGHLQTLPRRNSNGQFTLMNGHRPLLDYLTVSAAHHHHCFLPYRPLSDSGYYRAHTGELSIPLVNSSLQ
jgi:hypothetical protein